MAARTKNGKYPVDRYLQLLRASNRSEKTIEGYRKVIKSYAQFLNVPLDEIHLHLSVDNLLKYSDSRKALSPAGLKTNLSILHRYFHLNGVVFDELEFNAMRPKVVKEYNDKPLEISTLIKMMDLTDAHGKALLTFLVSTGCRADETCNLLMSDVNGDVVTIRNEIAKGNRGGEVYLTSEAREMMDLWLKERDERIALANKQTKGLIKCGASPRPVNDQRLFAISYTSMQKWFSRLYAKVDGEKGKYAHDKITVHSCRKYFRTTAARTLHPDLVTNLLRQTGYLDNVYVRISPEQKRKEFHEGEAALYLTRADHRIQGSKLHDLQLHNEELQKRLEQMEAAMLERSSSLNKIEMEDYSSEDIQKAIAVLKAMQKTKS